MGNSRSNRKSLPDLENLFAFSEATIRHGGGDRLLGSFFEAEDLTSGGDKLLKVWRRRGTQIDLDVREIWQNELRQVQRLLAYSGARDVIVASEVLVETADEIALVYERVGEPLSLLRDRASKSHWIKSLDVPRNRRLFWENIGRLVDAIAITHAQGIIHGNIFSANVFTEASGQADFMLGGYEYSLSLRDAEPSAAPRDTPNDRDSATLSFAADWRAIGSLILECLNARRDSNGIIVENAEEDRIDLVLAERQLLSKLLSPSSSELLDAESCRRSITEILASVGQQGDVQRKLVLRFANRSGLKDAVFDLSGERIPIDDLAAQLDWVRSELSGGATLYTPKAFDPQQDLLTLVSDRLVYKLVPHRSNRDATPEWDIAICTRVTSKDQLSLFGDETAHDLSEEVMICKNQDGTLEARANLRHLAGDWSTFAKRDESGDKDETVESIRTALLLLEGIDCLSAALGIHEVEPLEFDLSREPATITLRAKQNLDRDATAKTLRTETGHRALKRLFAEDQRDADSTWFLSPSQSFGDWSKKDVKASFVATTKVDGRDAYTFEIEGIPPSIEDPLFLRPGSDIGSERVIKRRLKNLRSLSTRHDVAAFFSNPWRMVRRSNQALGPSEESDPGFLDLDQSKQSALRNVWAYAPMHFVVGPPGVGKTKLACEHVRTAFERNPLATLLVTAQGHDALDNLQSRVSQAMIGSEIDELMVVRSERKTESQPSEFEPHVHAGTMLQAFQSSDLFRSAPPAVKDRTNKLSTITAKAGLMSRRQADKARMALGSMRSFVLESADVFVATTNSADIERLVDQKRQFDWAIVEEAAKATGSELLSPLMLASRSLLVGDHRQLPPFDADRLIGILSDADRLTAALQAISNYVAPLFEEDELQSFETLQSDPTLANQAAREAERLLNLFRSVVEEDQTRLAEDRRPYPLASELNEQRRMDPAIAELVSNTFYKGALKTHGSRKSGIGSKVRFSSSIPPSPIIVVNHPHISSTGSAEPHELPDRNWHSPIEAKSLGQFLRHLRAAPGKEKPSLAILSPYRAQVDLLRESARSWSDEQCAFKDAFQPIRRDLGFFGTIDSFQGSEADIVILSLVRNNARTGKGAVGFLRDKRRINVALSRAKHHLVIVGSLDFLSEAVRGVNPDLGDHELGFLTDMVGEIDRLSRLDRDGVPLATILSAEDLRARSWR